MIAVQKCTPTDNSKCIRTIPTYLTVVFLHLLHCTRLLTAFVSELLKVAAGHIQKDEH